MDKKLSRYIQAIYQIAQSQISEYKSQLLMEPDTPFTSNEEKIQAIERFIESAKLESWAKGLEKTESEQTDKG